MIEDMPLQWIAGLLPHGVLDAILFLIMAGYIYLFYRDYRKADKKLRVKLIGVYLALGILSAVVYIGVQASGLPEKMYPQYFNQEEQSAWDEYIDAQDSIYQGR